MIKLSLAHMDTHATKHNFNSKATSNEGHAYLMAIS